jgi:hypothetical protein
MAGLVSAEKLGASTTRSCHAPTEAAAFRWGTPGPEKNAQNCTTLFKGASRRQHQDSHGCRHYTGRARGTGPGSELQPPGRVATSAADFGPKELSERQRSGSVSLHSRRLHKVVHAAVLPPVNPLSAALRRPWLRTAPCHPGFGQVDSREVMAPGEKPTAWVQVVGRTFPPATWEVIFGPSTWAATTPLLRNGGLLGKIALALAPTQPASCFWHKNAGINTLGGPTASHGDGHARRPVARVARLPVGRRNYSQRSDRWEERWDGPTDQATLSGQAPGPRGDQTVDCRRALR